jgi:hypothetical protein
VFRVVSEIRQAQLQVLRGGPPGIKRPSWILPTSAKNTPPAGSPAPT